MLTQIAKRYYAIYRQSVDPFLRRHGATVTVLHRHQKIGAQVKFGDPIVTVTAGDVALPYLIRSDVDGELRYIASCKKELSVDKVLFSIREK